jgi:tetratricopeptide (TPR) repeat protein
MAEHFTPIPAYRCALAAIYSELGLLDEARREFEFLAANDFEGLPRDLFWVNCLDYLSYPCEALGDAERAGTLYSMLRLDSDRIAVGGAAGFVQGCLGRAAGVYAVTAGHLDEGIEQLSRALEVNSRAGLPHALAETQLDLAAARLARGNADDAPAAAALLDAAGELATKLGLGRLERRALELRDAGPVVEGGDEHERGRLGRFATRTSGDIRAALSTRGRAAMAKLLEQATDEELDRRFGSVVAQHTMLGAMARSFQPRMALGFEGDVLLGLTRPRETDEGRASDWWTIQVASRRARVRHRTSDAPAVTIHCSVPDFVRVFSGQTNMVAA